MEEKLQKSIDRAIALLKIPNEYENFLSIKLSPLDIGCCCSDCLPETWRITNEFIAPCGPIKHEGDVLIEKDGNKFVLEQHESGPEVLLSLALATAKVTLVKSIIDLLITIIKGLSKENRKKPSRIKIVSRRLNKKEEELIEIDIPISKNTEKQLEEKIKKAINKNP
ncbi:MAG: hypothetical protein ABIH18_00170 [Candidatus Omnitrophota bacterium]